MQIIAKNQSLNQQFLNESNIEIKQVISFIHNYVNYIVILLCLAMLYWFSKRIRHSKKHQHMNVLLNHKQIPPNKIILALQIKDLFITLASKYRPDAGQIPISTPQSSYFLIKVINCIFALKYFYRKIFPKKQITEFLSSLQTLPNIELFLYTSLKKGIAQPILASLQIGLYFKVQNRIYCDDHNKRPKKHAIDVDRDTRRVIIISTDKNDHYLEDDSYFLTIKPSSQYNFLRDTFKMLKNFFESSDNIDTLHDRLAELQVDMESDYSEGC